MRLDFPVEEQQNKNNIKDFDCVWRKVYVCSQ